MKIVVLIVRLLLGLVFFVFGLNAFLQFLKGPIPGGLAGQFLQALFQSHYGLAIRREPIGEFRQDNNVNPLVSLRCRCNVLTLLKRLCAGI